MVVVWFEFLLFFRGQIVLGLFPLMAEEDQQHYVLPPAVKRRRYDQQGHVDLDIEDRPCLVGRHLKEPVCLPTVVIEGTNFVRCRTREAWLHMVMSGRVCSDFLGAAIALTTNSIRIKAAAALKEDVETVRQAAATGRNALGLDDDSDDSDPDAQPASSARRRLPRGSCAEPKSAKTVSVSVHGKQLKVFLKGKTLWVDCDSECVNALCDEVALHLVPEALRAAREAARESREAELKSNPSALLDGSDKNIRFLPSRDCLMVKYTALDGSVKHHSKGLHIPTRTPYGEVMDADAYQAQLQQKIIEARQWWNEFDQSDRQRYVV